MTAPSEAVPLTLLREQLGGTPPLPALSGEHYARTHAAYEAASDQRSLLQARLVELVPPMLAGRDPLRVVGVGVGDGSVDAPLAAALATGGRRVRYTGIEPHAPSAVGFAGRLAALPLLTATVVIGDLAQHDSPAHPADLVHFVHSLYYVADPGAALDRALAMLRPGGLLVAATAPREPLCVLTELLCPWAEHRPWFAEDVRDALADRGLDGRSETIAARLDVAAALADPRGRGEAVLDFLVGARTAALRPRERDVVLDYLRAIALPGHPHHVPHPLEITVVRRPA